MINKFSEKHSFLSNFSPSLIIWDYRKWTTVEHLFQARKTNAIALQEKVRLASTPGKAKRLGRGVQLRADWEQVKFEIMIDCIRLKFSDPELQSKLVETFPHDLVEGNTWHDNEWGNCSCKRCKGIQGKNMLGEALLMIREKLICERLPKADMWKNERQKLLEMTTLLDEHPEGYEGPCLCKLCQTYF